MKIAIVHDWLTGMRGGEKCLEVFCQLFPDADLYTLVHVPGSVTPIIENRRIHTSFLQKIPFIASRYRYFLPLMPWAIEALNLEGYDLILSSSHCVAKGVRPPPGSLHICYCHTPMRYIWDQFDQYFGRDSAGIVSSTVMRWVAPALRRWDVNSSQRVDWFISNSRYVQKRIDKYYQRESTVIHPPVATSRLQPSEEPKEDFFLLVSAFAPYKRVDLAVEAFTKMGYPLVIVGEGQESEYLRRMAGPNVQFKGWLSDEEVRSCYARCRAFVFCGEEDFGITPVEAQAMGRPVIAFGRGGVLETVIPDRATWKAETNIPEALTEHPTGLFFYEQTPEALVSVVEYFKTVEDRFDPERIRRHALEFDLDIFTRHIKTFIEDRFEKHRC